MAGVMNRKPLPSDLTDEQWAILEPLIPAAKAGGHPRYVNMREVLNAIFYILCGDCIWRMMPHDFFAWKTVYHYFRQWRLNSVWSAVESSVKGKGTPPSQKRANSK